MSPSAIHSKRSRGTGLILLLAAFAAAAAVAQTTVKDWNEQGHKKSSSGDFQGAIADYTKAIALDPKFGDSYTYRGGAYADLKNYEAAIADFEKAMALDPDDWRALTDRAYAKRAKGDLDGAAIDFSELVRMVPDGDAHVARAGIRLSKGQLRAAIIDYGRAIEYDDRDADYWILRSGARMIRGDFTGALSDVDEAIELIEEDADNQYPLFLRFLVLRHLKRPDPGAELTAASAKWSDEWPKEIAQFLLGNTTEEKFLARAAQGTADDVSKNQCEAFYFAGKMRLFAGNTSAAVTLFEKCVATKITWFNEFDWARGELAVLKATP